MLGSKTLWGGLRQMCYMRRSIPASSGFLLGQFTCAAHSSKLKPNRKQKPMQRKTFQMPHKNNSLPLIAQVHGVGPSLEEVKDVEQRLKEIDENLEKLNDAKYQVFVSDIRNQIQDTYSKMKESLGEKRFEVTNERMEMEKKFKSRRAEPKMAPHIDYGTPDPSVPFSDVPCPGCGALLHCQDENIQGYIPSQKFEPLGIEELEKTLCQRCHLLKNHNISLNIRMDPNEFERIIKEIRSKVALVIVLVDLVDMPNSIINKLLDMVGRKHHVYIVGNKVDLLPRDGKGFLQRVLASLKKSCAEYELDGKCIKHACLVSAKTGYGIEELVTKLFNQWDRKGEK
jgi:hypothetical protein